MREKRALLIMYDYIAGGAETQMRYFIYGAEKRKCKLDVIVLSMMTKETAIELLQDMHRMKSVRIYNFHEFGAPESKRKRDLLLFLLKNLLHVKYEYCLIYSPQNLCLIPILKLFGIKTVYSERASVREIRNDVNMLNNLCLCDRIVANSEYAVKVLKKLTGKKVNLIKNGIPRLELLPQREIKGIKRILVPGRISPGKNPIMLIQFLIAYPDRDWKIVFAGEGVERAYRKKIDNLIKKNDLKDKAIFLGRVSNIKEEYEKADLVVLPSKAEGTPNVVLEAFGYGRPIVVSDIEAEKVMVKDRRLRFKLNSTEELYNCIRYVENLSYDDYVEMIENNRKFLLEEYDMDKMINAYCSLLKI